MRLEPLADYLNPQFGDIYTYNLHGYVGPGLEVQEWTDELRQAVKHYLLTEVDDGLFATLLDWLALDVLARDRGKQIDALIEKAEAGEIAHALHLIAVVTVPTLDELVGQLSSWPDGGVQDDVAEWLDAHASSEQLRELAELTGHPELNVTTPWYTPKPAGEHFPRALEPPALLAVWQHVVGLADTDLTDEEWHLLLPLVQERPSGAGYRPRNESELASLRRAFDGIRYKLTQDAPWSHVPSRYGVWHNVFQRYQNYQKRGEFSRMLSALQDQPAAERLTVWLYVVSADRNEGSAR